MGGCIRIYSIFLIGTNSSDKYGANHIAVSCEIKTRFMSDNGENKNVRGVNSKKNLKKICFLASKLPIIQNFIEREPIMF